MLHLFCYGSLMPDERNYLLVERFVQEATPSSLSGRLYLRSSGYPSLWLPEALIRRIGSSDYEADLAAHNDHVALQAPSDLDGVPVPGVVLKLRQGARVLALLDRFEGFYPGESDGRASDYRRVLVACQSGPVWTYACTEAQGRHDRHSWTPIRRWPVPVPEDRA